MAIEQNAEGLYAVQIGESEYTFAKWGAEEALSNLIKISKLVGKPFGILLGSMMGGEEEQASLFEGEKKGLLDKDINPDMLATAFEALANNMDEKEIIPLIKALTSKDVLCNGAKINFNQHYGSRLGMMFKVLKAGLEVQYGNFFEELQEFLPVKKVGLSNRGPATSTGQSGLQ